MLSGGQLSGGPINICYHSDYVHGGDQHYCIDLRKLVASTEYYM